MIHQITGFIHVSDYRRPNSDRTRDAYWRMCVVGAAHILAAGKAPVLVIGASRAVDGLSASGSWFPGREKQRSLWYRIKQIMRLGWVNLTKVRMYVWA